MKKFTTFSENEIRYLISSFYLNYQDVELNEEILITASNLRNNYSFSFWDGLIVSSALYAEAEILYSEDMQNGLVVENKLKIVIFFQN